MPSDLAIGRLALQFQPQRALGALAFGGELIALELQPASVAIEDLFQRRNHDAGEARFDLRTAPRAAPSRRAAAQQSPVVRLSAAFRRLRAKSAMPITASMIRSQGKGMSHRSPASVAKSFLRRGQRAAALDGHDLEVRDRPPA